MNPPHPLASRTFDVPIDDHVLRVRTLTHADRAARARPTLVFLHDSLGCITLWRDFPDRLALATGCDALIYDRRGYGASSPFDGRPRHPDYLEREADALATLLARTGVSGAILFGHSDGGSIALVTAARHPARVHAVISEAAHVFVEELTLAGIRAARDAFAETDLPQRLARYHGERTAAVASAWIDTWLSPTFRDWNIEGYLPDVRGPVLVVQGSDDEFGTDAQVRAIAEGVSGAARTLVLPGVGHTPHRDAADLVLAESAAFVAESLAG